MQLAVLIRYLLCVVSGGECLYVEDAHVTEYVPELGGLNCEEPCDKTAYMTPVIYGETVACGPDIPYATRVYIQGVGWRVCQDRGGAIENNEIDVAVRPEEYLIMGYSGYRKVVWVLPDGARLDEPVGVQLREIVGRSLRQAAGGAVESNQPSPPATTGHSSRSGSASVRAAGQRLADPDTRLLDLAQ